jgi:spermidine synthase
MLILFAASGCAALIYEVVWFQLLQVVIGSSAISLGLLLGTYMGGLCLGSLGFSRLIRDRRHPLSIVAILEAGIGSLGLLILIIVPHIGRMYASVTPGTDGIFVRGVVCAVCLLPPTLLMGATLPAASRWLEGTNIGMSRLGLLYGVNIVGGVLGCVGAGFYLLRVFDLAIATYTAVTINAAVALLSSVLASRSTYRGSEARAATPNRRVQGSPAIYIAIGLSGLCALGAQVVWTRQLSLMLGATVYTFSIILAVFLIGLGIGANLGAVLARRTPDPRLALAWCQSLAAGAVAWTAFMCAKSLPYWPIDPWLSLSPWFNFQVDLLRTMWTILPATVLWGASFPLTLAALATQGVDPARISGQAYAANTAGAIIGALGFSIVLIPWIGTAQSQQVLIALSVASAVTVLAAAAFCAVPNAVSVLKAVGWLGAATALAIGLAATVSDVPWQAIAYGRRMSTMIRSAELNPGSPPEILFRGEGINSSLLITREGKYRVFSVSGKAEASSAPADMRLQRMIGHIPALVHPSPQRVLVVGFGSGVTAGSFVVYPTVEAIVIAELEPLVTQASGRHFRVENNAVVDDRRTTIVYDDARHYILTSQQKFDVITSDPIHPWVKGTATLYSKEYFELVKEHLNAGGIAAQWLPLYDSDRDTVKSVLATFFAVFPQATIWSNHVGGRGYDLVLLGHTSNTTVDIDALQTRMERQDHSGVVSSLGEVGFQSAIDVLMTYAGRAIDLRPWLTGTTLNLDRNLRLQYLAGMGVNSMAHAKIYEEMLGYRFYPDGLLTGSATNVQILNSLLQPRLR